jgi:hypothetical protein
LYFAAFTAKITKAGIRPEAERAMGTVRHRHATIIVTAFAAIAGLVLPALADKGDRQGWSLGSDPRKRVFLTFVAVNDGPRLVVIGCLRDVDSLIVLSAQELGVGSGRDLTLTLENGPARYVVQGKFEPNGVAVGQAGFASEIDADAKVLRQVRSKLLAVLEGKGPIVLTVGSTSRELPVAGLDKALRGFKSVCFGQL